MGRDRLLSSLKEQHTGDELASVLASLGELRTAKEYKLVLHACCQLRQWRRALSIFDELDQTSGLQPDVYCFKSAMRACQGADQLNKVQWLVARMTAHGVRPDAVIARVANRSFGVAISAHEKAGQWEQALALLGQMHAASLTPDIVSFNALVSACHKGGQWEHALSLLGEMRRAGVAPDTISYNAAISACGRGGRWEQALSLLEEMPRVGVAATVVTFNAAASACEKGGQWEHASKLLEKMHAVGIQPDVLSYNAAISACGKGKQCQRALSLLQEMARRGVMPDAISYVNAIRACGRAGEWERALSLLAEMRVAGVERGVEGVEAVRRHQAHHLAQQPHPSVPAPSQSTPPGHSPRLRRLHRHAHAPAWAYICIGLHAHAAGARLPQERSQHRCHPLLCLRPRPSIPRATHLDCRPLLFGCKGPAPAAPPFDRNSRVTSPHALLTHQHAPRVNSTSRQHTHRTAPVSPITAN